ncbi:MAG: hypothetical protein E2O47_06325 [Gemmatimonadetes bacterium]|nr:MAG: hypothetical protein E2O47_06325 [Gemmatimonadota bacterium]
MSPYFARRHGNPIGTLIVERQFNGVPRIIRASGTRDPKLADKYAAMLDTLYDPLDRLDILTAIADGVLPIKLVHHHFTRHTLHRLPTVEGMTPLTAMAEWAKTADGSDRYTQEMGHTFKRVAALKRGGSINDLPKLIEGLRRVYRDRPVGFNRMRAHVLSYLNNTVGDDHPLYIAVRKVKPYPKQRSRSPVVLQPAEALALVGRAPSTDPGAVMKRHQEELWSLLTTGMLPKEYFIDGWVIRREPGRVEVHGTKRGGRERVVPLVEAPVVPRVTGRYVMRALQLVRPEMVLKDCRNIYRHWLEEVGVSPSRAELYMGHGLSSVRDLYTWHDVKPYLEEDAEKLRAYLGIEARGVLEVAR